MKRPEQHEIDDAAQQQFRGALPRSWVVRELHPDYGLDYLVEVFEGGGATGIQFFAQLKGTRIPAYRDTALHLRFETDKLEYYLRCCPLPVFIVVADIVSRHTFWLFAQQHVREVIAKESPDWISQGTVTLRMPTEQEVATRTDLLRKQAEEGREYLSILHFGVPAWQIKARVDGCLLDPETFREQVQADKQRLTEMEFHEVQILLACGRPADAHARLEEVLSESTSAAKADVRLHAATGLGHLSRIDDPRENRRIVARLATTIREAEPHATPAFLLAARATLYHMDSMFHFGEAATSELFAQIAAQFGRGTDSVIQIQRAEHLLAATESLDRLLRTTMDAVNARAMRAVVISLLHLADISAWHFIRARKSPAGTERAAKLAESALAYSDAAVDAAAGSSDPAALASALERRAKFRHLAGRADWSEDLDHAESVAAAGGVPYNTNVVRTLRELLASGELLAERPQPDPGAAVDPTARQQDLARWLAQRAGLDLDDPNDESAKVVRVGLADANPERVLRYCSHLHVAHGSFGLVGEMLALPTAGTKCLHCDVKRRTVEGFALDEIMADVRTRYCESCADRDPRPEDWQWTPDWQAERERTMPESFRRVLGRRRGDPTPGQEPP